MALNRLLVNICSDQLEASKHFYTSLFGFTVSYDSDWFINLQSPDQALELGIITRHHDIVPEASRKSPQGIYLTFVVEDVDVLFEKVQQLNVKVVKAPHDTFYGQRRLLLADPDGVVVDVSSPTSS